MPAQLADAVTAQYRRCIRGGTPIRYEITLDFPVGTRHWQSVLTPVRNRLGDIYRIIGSSRDRTAEVEARELAKTSQGLLQGVIEAAPDIIYLVDLVDARVTVIGGPVHRVLGYTGTEINNLSRDGLKAIVHPGDLVNLEAHRAWTRRMEDDAIATAEYRVRRADGTYTWLSCREKILSRDGDGGATTVLGIATSIQARKESEWSLQLAHLNLRRTLQSITDCYFTLDRSYRLTDVNQACLDWMGMRRGQVVGASFWDFCTTNDPCAGLMKESLEKHRPAHAELRSALRPDRWLDYHIYPSRNGAVIFFHDVTGRKLAEQKALSSRGLLLAALNAMPAHIAILDSQGVIIDVNSAWHRFAENNGYIHPEHGIGKNYLEICRAAADSDPSGARIAEHLETVLAGKVDTFALEYLCGDRWFQLRANRFESGGSIHVVVAHEDISELVLVKQTLTMLDDKQRRDVSQLMRQSVVNRLSSSIAHELNQPLAAIMSNAEAAIAQLETGSPDIETVRETLQDIVDEDRRAADVISRVRSLIKRDTGKFEIISIDKLVDATLSLLRGELARRGIEIQTDLQLPLRQVRGDFVELQQVLINMLMNAMEAFTSTPGQMHNQTIMIKSRAADDRVGIIVSDNGSGVLPALQANLFEPFVSTKSEGLGLGLSICAAIAESHGGNIALENNHDRGASAVLTLPLGKGE